MGQGTDQQFEVDKAWAEELRELGFDPGWPIYPISPADEIQFTQDDIQRALFESTYTKPHLLEFSSVGLRDPWYLHMVVASVRVLYPPQEVPFMDRDFGAYDFREWYLRGFLYKSPFDTYPELVTMHALVEMGLDDPRQATIQLVPRPSGATPDTPMKWAKGVPEHGRWPTATPET